MSTSDVAHGLTDLCREGRFDEAVDRFYSPGIVSVEPVGSPEMPAEISGLEAVRAKGQWWAENNEIHRVEVVGPFVGEEQFAVHYTMDTTFKPSGLRSVMSEMALYTVEDGRITREEFFYHVPADT